MKAFALGIACLLVALTPASAQVSAPPRIFYSDLESGPNTGGQDDKGTIVTIYGRGFGSTRGQSIVSVGGEAADNYPIWSDTKIAFQIGKAARSGDIVVTAPGGVSSNGVRFLVRPGRIHFVALSGSDTNSGTFSSPWKTLIKAKNAMGSGDITYAMDGVTQTGLDTYGASLAIISSGAPNRPIALVAYPGATVKIGSVAGPEYAIRTPALGRRFNDWVLAGLTLQGGNQSLKVVLVSDWRIVANDMSCPHGDGAAACLEAAGSDDLRVLGNFVHDAGRNSASKQYHSVYFTTDSNHVEVGWNVIANNHSCRGIQFHSSPLDANSGFNQYDLIVHDNLIHDQVCDGINFATIDPSKGPVVAYNNVIYHVGTGPDPSGGLSNYACISSPGITNRGAPGSGMAEFYNNTLYDCGSRGGGTAGAINVGAGSPVVRLRNNIIVAQPGEEYIEKAGSPSKIVGSHNLWFGAGSGPVNLNENIDSEPRFTHAAAFDFHLQPESPAIGKGLPTGIATDFDGIPRPQSGACDVGAFQRPKGVDTPVPGSKP